MSVTMVTQLTVRINDELEEMLEEYRKQHDFPPDKSEVVRVALREYLEKHSDDG